MPRLYFQGNPIPTRPPSPTQQSQAAGKQSTIPPFKPIPPAPERPFVPNETKIASPAVAGVAVPVFSAMPGSISRLSDGPTLSVDTSNGKITGLVVPVSKNKGENTNFAVRTLPAAISDVPTNSIQALLASTNLTEKAIEAALIQKQKTTTYKPAVFSHKQSGSVGKVMNAPKEYYPVGYDKNFDDNFSSRVELPDTSFHCGDQKHFPGLYADEDLGCMVSDVARID